MFSRVRIATRKLKSSRGSCIGSTYPSQVVTPSILIYITKFDKTTSINNEHRRSLTARSRTLESNNTLPSSYRKVAPRFGHIVDIEQREERHEPKCNELGSPEQHEVARVTEEHSKTVNHADSRKLVGPTRTSRKRIVIDERSLAERAVLTL